MSKQHLTENTRLFSGVCFALFIGCCFAFSSLLLAQTDDDPNYARGLDPEQYFQNFGNEDINVLNGNLSLSFPIGLNLKHNGNLSLQLRLHYNSKIWATEIKPLEGLPDQQRVAYLEGRSPVGIGFNLHLGKVYDRVNHEGGGYVPEDEIYFESLDGNRHRLFYDSATDYWETKDGSFIRGLRIMNGPEVDHWEIYLPSGKCWESISIAGSLIKNY